MALPKLNQNPLYELEIPSTKQKIRYRPYLVKEEKVLMLALESNSASNQIQAVLDTIQVCVGDSIKVNDLPTFDIDYIFTKIRTKSVGEIAKLKYTCQHNECNATTDIEVNLDSVIVNIPEINKEIQVTDDIKVIIDFPTYKVMNSIPEAVRETSAGLIDVIAACIKQIHTEDEVILTEDCTQVELTDFIDSMTGDQFKKISDVFEQIPQVTINHKFACIGCAKENSIEVKGLENFFG